MKKLIFSTLLMFIGIFSLSAQSKIEMTVTQNGHSKVYHPQMVAYDLNLLTKESKDSLTAYNIQITLGQHLDDFLLKSASRKSSGKVDMDIRFLDKNGKEKQDLKLKNIYISDISDTYNNDAGEESDYTGSFMIYTDQVQVNGVTF